MMVQTVIICVYSCERSKSKSYCVTVFNTAYIAYAESEETKPLCWLYYKLRNFAFFLIALQCEDRDKNEKE